MNLKKILPFIGILLFAYVLYFVGLEKIFTAISRINLSWLAFIILFTFIVPFFQTLKWYTILHKQGIITEFHLSYWYILKIQYISQYYGFITPGRIGGFIKLFYLKEKTNSSYGKATSSVLLEKVLDLTIVFTLGILGSLFFITKFSNMYLPIILALACMITGLVFFFNKKLNYLVVKRLFTILLPKKFETHTHTLFEDFYTNLLHPTTLAFPLFITLTTWVLIYLQSFFIALALGVPNTQVAWYYYILFFPIATIFSLFPITVAGLGTREVSLVALFSIFSIPSETIIAISLITTITTILPLLFGFFYSFKEPLSLLDQGTK